MPPNIDCHKKKKKKWLGFSYHVLIMEVIHQDKRFITLSFTYPTLTNPSA